jgi:hypothetical protein
MGMVGFPETPIRNYYYRLVISQKSADLVYFATEG